MPDENGLYNFPGVRAGALIIFGHEDAVAVFADRPGLPISLVLPPLSEEDEVPEHAHVALALWYYLETHPELVRLALFHLGEHLVEAIELAGAAEAN